MKLSTNPSIKYQRKPVAKQINKKVAIFAETCSKFLKKQVQLEGGKRSIERRFMKDSKTIATLSYRKSKFDDLNQNIALKPPQNQISQYWNAFYEQNFLKL